MKLAVVGVGKLGGALLESLLEQSLFRPDEVGLIEHDLRRAQALSVRWGVKAIRLDELKDVERILLAVKPHQFPSIAPELIHPHVGYVSTMAGIDVKTLSRRLKTDRVVRVMPNLGAIVGRSATAITAPPLAHEAGDYAFGRMLFSSVGDVYDLQEDLFDAFTGLSGSGPAYAAVFAEALSDGGVRMGLPRGLALELAAKTLIATGELLLTRPNPASLKDEVASPGGTTIAGLTELERYTFRIAAIEAVAAATRRGREIGKGVQDIEEEG